MLLTKGGVGFARGLWRDGRLNATPAEHRQERRPYFLTLDDFGRTLQWKLRSHYGRAKRHLSSNNEAAYRAVSEAVFRIVRIALEYECAVRFGLLTALPGIGVAVASAVLALTEPERYCVVDSRGWRSIFGEQRASFSIPDYLRYWEEVSQMASELGWAIQEADLAIWEFDRLRSAHAT